MVKHIVMFKLNGDSETRRRIAGEFAAALMELPEKIECLRSMEVGLNAKHPAHVAAAAIVGPHKAARACVDYIID